MDSMCSLRNSGNIFETGVREHSPPTDDSRQRSASVPNASDERPAYFAGDAGLDRENARWYNT